MKLRLFPISFLFAAASFAQALPQNSAAAKHPFTFEDMMALKRLSEPVPSPDGTWGVFAAEDVDLEANTKKSPLWIVPASGGESTVEPTRVISQIFAAFVRCQIQN